VKQESVPETLFKSIDEREKYVKFCFKKDRTKENF
jgi:hypothetical protein